MCPPSDNFHDVGNDKYLGHRIVADSYAKYISLTPGLHCHPFRYPSPSLPQPEPLMVYIAHSIHYCEVPEIVAYAGLYLLISLSQPCQCRLPHEDNQSPDGGECALSSPTKISHILSRAVTRTPFSSKPHWSDRHIFAAAFYLAIAIYKDILLYKHKRLLPCWNKLHLVFGICQKEIVEVAGSLRPYISPELEVVVKSMIEDDYIRDIGEVDCPFVQAQRKRLLKAEEAKVRRQNRIKNLKASMSVDSVVRMLQKKPKRIL